MLKIEGLMNFYKLSNWFYEFVKFTMT